MLTAGVNPCVPNPVRHSPCRLQMVSHFPHQADHLLRRGDQMLRSACCHASSVGRKGAVSAISWSASMSPSGKRTVSTVNPFPASFSSLCTWRQQKQRKRRQRICLQDTSTAAAVSAQQTDIDEATPSQQHQAAAVSQPPPVSATGPNVKAIDGFCVVNFYHLADVEEPEKVALPT